MFDRKNDPSRDSTQSAIFLPVQDTISLDGDLSVNGGYHYFRSGSLVLINSLNLSFLPILNKKRFVTKEFFMSLIFYSSAEGS